MRMRRLAVPFVLSVLVFVLAGLFAPSTARASSFSMPHVHIEAEVQQDGSLTVTEQRMFSFDESVNGVFWDIPLGANKQGATADIQVQRVSDGTTDYQQVSSAENGESGVYTAETTDSDIQLKVYAPHADGDEATISITYSLTGAVMSWNDTAELYWKFVGSGWAEDSDDVQLSVSFAGASSSGVAASTGSDSANLRAWGHGPLDGDVALDAGTPAVTYAVPTVNSDEFAEARIVFPTAWVPQLAPGNAPNGEVDSSGNRLPVILSEEQTWADQANRAREAARQEAMVLGGVGIAASVCFFLAVVIVKIAFGRKPKPLFQETYFRDVPSDDHPAVIAAFLKNKSVGNAALVSTIMKLTDDHIVSVSKTTSTTRTFFGGERQEDDYLLRVPEDYEQRVKDDIDRAAIKLYCGEGRYEIAFQEMKKVAEDDPEGYSERWRSYTSVVRDRLESRDLVRSTGLAAGIGGSIVGGISLFLGIIFCAEAGWLVMIPVVAVLSTAGIVLSWTFKRFTPEGAELYARCRALKHWFEDFTRLHEAVPGDVVLWNKLLVFAVALGVSDQVLEDLAAATPTSYDNSFSDGYYPSWWWYRRHEGMETPTSALTAANDVAISTIAASSESSGGGFGGGFSGGGGGGVGGGGGGTF